jgi:hypothetical protein
MNNVIAVRRIYGRIKARGTSFFFLAFELASSSATFSNNCFSSLAAHSYIYFFKKNVFNTTVMAFIMIHTV